ncbi:META domain-containing protein [Streptomyces sp. A3M-1-3]|uniref:META domain-containing protein n=1 Tax=Streptomyces sp. A3M-1-3 TaxID=2962044 RepID=UPI0020B6721C|nr:META domain-containing protein [Streptomyces sp. A3M-1-3]MCP3817982.1 META domain-containing protein [Streptomyces sp. A3M-1-3]
MTTAVLALLTLTACGTETGAGGGGGSSVDTALPVTGVKWNVDSLTVNGKQAKAPAGAHVEIDAKGRASGNFGCNQFGADVTVKGDSITVGAGQSTEIGCEKELQNFETALSRAFAGELKAKLAGDKLTLTTQQGDTIALTSKPEKPEKPAQLIGPEWAVDSLLDGGTASSLPADVLGKAQLTFGKDGTVRGNLGCNNVSGKATVDGSTITFGTLATTRRMCPGPVMETERALHHVLEGKATYKIDGHTLSLTAADGKGLGATAIEAEPRPKK